MESFSLHSFQAIKGHAIQDRGAPRGDRYCFLLGMGEHVSELVEMDRTLIGNTGHLGSLTVKVHPRGL